MSTVMEKYLEAFAWRHACKEFVSDKKIKDTDFNFILETARLSPSSLGLEPWRFLVVQNKSLREKMLDFVPGGQKQIPTASHLLVVLARTHIDMHHESSYVEEKLFMRRDLPVEIDKKMRAKVADFQKYHHQLLDDNRYISDWAGKQTYIALGNMMNAAALIGVDSCPIEGFSIAMMRDFLSTYCQVDMDKFTPSYLLAFGYRKSPPKEKLRSALSEIVEWFV